MFVDVHFHNITCDVSQICETRASDASHEEKEQQRLMIRKVQGACAWKLNNLREVT
jgi:hypothetical protein